MRKIKFRAWNGKAMVDPQVQEEWLAPDLNSLVEALQSNGLILMQYTGLKDKNGDNEIYECDIVEEPGSRYEVVYHADGFYMRDMHEPDNMLIQLRHGYLHCEVIGNIYENPELLEQL